MKKVDLLLKISFYLILLFLVIPFIILIIWSFAESWPWPHLIPEIFSIRGVEYLLKSNELKILFESICISLVVTLVTLILALPAAKSTVLYEFKGKKLFKIILMAPIIFPVVTISMGIHITFIKLGLVGTVIGVVIVHIFPCMPYAFRILCGVYEIIGDKYEMQAKVLGANKVQRLTNVVIPMLGPGILSAASMTFIVSFSQYFLTLMIGGGNVKTFTMVLFPYVQSGDRMIGSLYSIVFTLVTLIILILFDKLVKRFYRQNEV